MQNYIKKNNSISKIKIKATKNVTKVHAERRKKRVKR